MDSWTAASVSEKQWYLAVGNRSIGPLTTDLVMRGIQSGRVPLTAWACQVGASHWSALSSFSEFQAALGWSDAVEANLAQHLKYGRSPLEGAPNDGAQASPVGASDSDTEQDSGVVSPGFTVPCSLAVEPRPSTTPDSAVVERQSGHRAAAHDHRAEASFGHDAPEPLPSFSDEPEGSGVAGAMDALSQSESHGAEELVIDVQFDEEHDRAINWLERFQSYFLVGAEVELPEENELLSSLRQTSRETFLHDEALWNLSLCLAFGSDLVADTSARTFFEAIGPEEGVERVEWICRTLLSKGFMPSGIPRSDGMRGIEILRQTCPPELRPALEREAME